MKRILPVITMLAVVPAAAALEFNRDIRPILSENCFACHGPDEKARKAKLRLDASGADMKEVMRRVTTTDSDEIMPPPESHKKPLNSAQTAALKQWIAEGAKYQRHWAFEPPVAQRGSSIDDFVKAKLATKGLTLAPRGAPSTLMRRLSLDLTGLPPTLSDLSDPSDRKLETYIDCLLNSPHFGEHMAVAWLDVARYADTNGYFGDKPRSIWPWRDWVINAFNANMPF
ncbi:MAG: DUF1549 domain-containing protein, partial [Verrucomicrobiaceae bacterium]|nr:DUF1549 domain-containing protein [Verrucomicrobiaceae bacterium]